MVFAPAAHDPPAAHAAFEIATHILLVHLPINTRFQPTFVYPFMQMNLLQNPGGPLPSCQNHPVHGKSIPPTHCRL